MYCLFLSFVSPGSENGEVMDARNIFLPENRDVDASSAEVKDVPLCMPDSRPERQPRCWRSLTEEDGFAAPAIWEVVRFNARGDGDPDVEHLAAKSSDVVLRAHKLNRESRHRRTSWVGTRGVSRRPGERNRAPR